MAVGFRPDQDVPAQVQYDQDPEAMAAFAEAKALEAADLRLQKSWTALAAAWRRATQVHPVGSGTGPSSL